MDPNCYSREERIIVKMIETKPQKQTNTSLLLYSQDRTGQEIPINHVQPFQPATPCHKDVPPHTRCKRQSPAPASHHVFQSRLYGLPPSLRAQAPLSIACASSNTMPVAFRKRNETNLAGNQAMLRSPRTVRSIGSYDVHTD